MYFRRYDLGQANTQTDTLITILRSPIVGGVTTITVTVSLPVNAVMFQFHDFTCIPTPILYRPANFSWRNIALLQFLRRWPSAVVVHKLSFSNEFHFVQYILYSYDALLLICLHVRFFLSADYTAVDQLRPLRCGRCVVRCSMTLNRADVFIRATSRLGIGSHHHHHHQQQQPRAWSRRGDAWSLAGL